jgi:K+ transporter
LFRTSHWAQGFLLSCAFLAPAMEMGDGVLTPAISGARVF